jgi:RNA polymerase sigma-70 factor (ECF subfamily)
MPADCKPSAQKNPHPHSGAFNHKPTDGIIYMKSITYSHSGPMIESGPVGRKPAVPYAREMSELDDSALMLRYQDGDTAAFEALYRRHNDSLYRYLLRLSLDSQVAEDVFQDAWAKIIRARAGYRPTARFSTYLFRVAHNCFIDYLRRNRRHTHAGTVDPDQTESEVQSPDDLAERTLARRRLEAGLAALPEDQRDAFLLYEEAGLSIDDIARVTDVNRETAKSRLRYAVRKLRSAIAAGTPV